MRIFRSTQLIKKRTNNYWSRGFTLIEMLVVAPIVILSIGAFIALIVNLTGEVMSSRGSNSLAYDVQDTLNRIEQDVKLSTGFLAFNNVALDSTNQVQSYDDGATTNLFKNTGNGNGPILILNALVTTGNPTSTNTSNVYLHNQPAACNPTGNPQIYMKNRPMTYNIVYFVKDNTLWRRTLMPSNYNNSTIRCGQAETFPWQQPSCTPGYSSSFCKTNDIKLIENFSNIDFSLQYFTAAGSSAPIANVANPSTSDEVRNTSLQSATTVMASIVTDKTIAGRDISRSGMIRASRLDTNATSMNIPQLPTAAPGIPIVSGVVSDGHNVTFSWPVVSNATSYDLRYRINGGAWQEVNNIGLNNRSYLITTGNHTDVVEGQVRSKNICTSGTCLSNYSTSTSITIPLWAPLVMYGGWTRYHNSYAAPAYTKTSAGVIMLKGLVASGGVPSTIGILPPDYRPSNANNSMIFQGSSGGSGQSARIDVFSGGEVYINNGLNGWVSLDGIQFMHASSTYTNLALQNGWVNYSVYNSPSDTRWSLASYTTDSLSRVHTRGLIGNGVSAAGTVIASSLPPPPSYMIVANINSGVNGHISINSSGQLIARGGANGYVSLQTMYYPAAARANGTNCTTQWCALPLTSPWVWYGSPHTRPLYTKSPDNIVMVTGLVKSGAVGPSAGLAMLPAGFCPKERLLIASESVDVWGRVDVVPNSTPGTGCALVPYTANNVWLSLDSIIFLAEQ